MNLFDLVATLGLDSSEYEKGLDDAERTTEGFGTKLKKGIGTAIKATTAAVGAGVAGVTALTKAAVDNFADYEQLVGGIETLFGDSAGKVVRDAENAFKTAGMSMNDYMETSIQSAAALINSLEGDQEKAADLMNMSIIDMSDNVNKMGTSVEAVQNAYRGFSRGNFTMLDNLALGYAGTKEGMEQLLDKAKEISGFEYDISSYSDIVQAIHVVQTEMGIAGTTQKEAAETISGSISSMKSAWTNFITGLATGDSDIEALVSNLVTGFETVLNNIAPVIERVLKGIGDAVVKLAPVIADKLPALFTEFFPKLVSAGATLISTFAGAILDNAPTLIDAFTKLISDIVVKFSEPDTLNKFIDGIGQIITNIADAFISNLPLLTKTFITLIDNLIQVIGRNLPKIVNGAKDIITSLISGMSKMLPDLIKYIPTVVKAITSAINKNLPLIIKAATEIIMSLLDGFNEMLPDLVDFIGQLVESIAEMINNNLPMIISAAVQIIASLLNGLSKALPSLIAYIPKLVTTIVDVIVKNLPLILDAALEIIMALVQGLTDNLPEIIDAITTIVNSLVDFILDNLGDFLDAGIDILMAIVDGLLDPDNLLKLVDAAVKIVSKVTGKIAEKLPELLDKGGEMLGKIISGLLGAIPDLILALPKIFNTIFDEFGKQDWVKIGKDILGAVINGIFQTENTLRNALKSAAIQIYNGIADVFGWDKVETGKEGTGNYAKYMAMSAVQQAVTKAAYIKEHGEEAWNEWLRGPTTKVGRTRNVSGEGVITFREQEPEPLTSEGSGVTINVYGAEGQNVSELADAVSQRIAMRTRQERMAW